MFESKVPLCLSGEFIAQPKPGQTSIDRAETSPEGGVASTAPLPGGETASGRVGRCDDQRPLTRWGEELGAPRMVINRLNCLAPVLSRAVDVTMSNGNSGPFYGHNGSGDILNAQSWHAHGTAQNRRELVR